MSTKMISKSTGAKSSSDKGSYTISHMMSMLSCKECEHFDEKKGKCQFKDSENNNHDADVYHECLQPKHELLEEAVLELVRTRKEKSDKKSTEQGLGAAYDMLLGLPLKEIAIKHDTFAKNGKNILGVQIRLGLKDMPDTKATAALCKFLFEERKNGMAYTPKNESFFYEYEKTAALRLLSERRAGKTIMFDGVPYLIIDQEEGNMLLMAMSGCCAPMKRDNRQNNTPTAQEICYYWLSDRPEIAKRAITDVRLLSLREYKTRRIRNNISFGSGSFWLGTSAPGNEDAYYSAENGDLNFENAYNLKVEVRPVVWISPEASMAAEAERMADDKMKKMRREYEKKMEQMKLNASMQVEDAAAVRLRRLAEKEAHFMGIPELNEEERSILLSAVKAELREIQETGNYGNAINLLAEHLGMSARI